MIYTKVHTLEDEETVFVFDVATGENFFAKSDEPCYDEIKDVILSSDEHTTTVEDILTAVHDIRHGTVAKAEEERIANLRKELGIVVGNDTIILPGNVVLPVKVADIFQNMTTREEGESLVKFARQLSENKRSYAREALVEWILHNPSLTILPDGRIRGYRGLREDYTSIHSGFGIVNGKVFSNAHLDNSPGNIIEFPEEMIDHNTSTHCSIGLHVGTWSYASSFGWGQYVAVAFSPADVVSPPSDAEQAKIRVSRMEILEELNKDSLDKLYLDNN